MGEVSLDDMRPVTHPMVDGFTNAHLRVLAGPIGAGGVPHRYVVTTRNDLATPPVVIGEIRLQEGPVADGVNGMLNTTLLLILLDFLKCAQEGELRSREGALQITELESALHWSKQRELDRDARGVLGTYQK